MDIADEQDDGTDAASAPQSRLPRILGITSVSIGGASLIGWGLVGGMALKLHSDMEADCKPDGCPAGRRSDKETLDTLTTTSTALVCAGVGFAALGTILLIVQKRHQNEAVAVAPVFGPRFAGAALTGRF